MPVLPDVLQLRPPGSTPSRSAASIIEIRFGPSEKPARFSIFANTRALTSSASWLSFTSGWPVVEYVI